MKHTEAPGLLQQDRALLFIFLQSSSVDPDTPQSLRIGGIKQ